MMRISAAAMLALLPLSQAGAQASDPAAMGYTDPGAIDRAVAQFTGASIGEVGGARQPADRRLRLALCSQPLTADWHGRTKSTVRVECPDVGGWRIFVATHTPPAATQAQKVVKRGDPLTVVVRGRGFTVQQTGEAMENGAVGDWIAIRTGRRAEPIRARIERPGLAVIPAN